jgi:hypothetical protein
MLPSYALHADVRAHLKVEVEGLNLIVSGGGFCAVNYCAVHYKSTDQPQLLLRLRTKTLGGVANLACRQ